MKVEVNWTGNLSFVGMADQKDYQVQMGTSVENGGNGTGVTPMELVLMGLAGCSGMDVVSILNKKRLDFTSLKITVEGTRAVEHPKVFTSINVTYTFSGDNLQSQLKALEDSVRLSMDKYCSVAGMLNKTAQINWQVEIE